MKLRNIILILCVLVAGMLTATPDARQKAYIERYAEAAQKEMKRSGVPASITLAQGILESTSGTSDLAVKANNHFGIKAEKGYKGASIKMPTTEEVNGKKVKMVCDFRKYKSVEESYRDHGNFLRYKPRYASLFELDPTDYKAWAKGLKQCGYATDSQYGEKLIALIESCNLSQYDFQGHKSSVEVGQKPTKDEKPSAVNKTEVVKTPVTVAELNKEEKVQPKKVADETYTVSIQREQYRVNKTLFIKARKGDTYASIASLYGLFPREILSFNEVPETQLNLPLEEGRRVFLQKKRRYGARGIEGHVADEGESLKDICDLYAVRVSSISKLNAFGEDYVPEKDHFILLRKEFSFKIFKK